MRVKIPEAHARSVITIRDRHEHMQHMSHAAAWMPPTREGSGTSWLPDETPMSPLHRASGGWTLMAHGNGFVQSFGESGDRGSDPAGGVNWIMGMAHRAVAGGQLQLRGMVSRQPIAGLTTGPTVDD